MYMKTFNQEIKEYINILSNNNYPTFMDKYVETPEFQRLDGIDLFCGMYYSNVPLLKMKYFFSRLHHSIACALITHALTDDKAQTLCALFHDLGTPAFSHANDFKMGDSVRQLSSEQKIINVIGKSETINRYLKEDGISINDVVDPKMYPIIDKDIPCLCADRLEGIFSTGLVWGQYWGIEDIRKIYDYIAVFEEDKGRWFLPGSERAMNYGIEMGICEELFEFDAEQFFEGIIKYSILLQTKEDKFGMKILGDILKLIEKKGIVKPEEFYLLSEQEIISRIMNSNCRILWEDFTRMLSVDTRMNACEDANDYYNDIASKVRFCSPLVLTAYGVDELLCISSDAQDEYYKFLTHLYENGNHVIGSPDLSAESKKMLKSLKNFK